ncbi:MAG: hypothetical protein LLF78_04675 [Synergistaceae bacterium]|nr:hypothetical protein [Synergistaceae bacterium]
MQPKPGSYPNRNAFSLVELIIVLLIIITLSGGITVATMGGGINEDSVIQREADDLVLWLSDRMAMAQTEECGFRLYVLGHGGSAVNADLTIIWLGGRLANTSETYRSAKAYIWPESQVNQFYYDGEWQTLTPALTMSVKPMPPSKGKKLYVIVSGTGYIRVSTKSQ